MSSSVAAGLPDSTAHVPRVVAAALRGRAARPRVADPAPTVRPASSCATYRWLVAACWLGNLLVASVLMGSSGRLTAEVALRASLLDVAVAVLIRDQRVMNGLYRAIGSVRGLPLPGSRRWSDVHQIGGLHLGAATAGVVWFLVSTSLLLEASADSTTTAATVLQVAILLVLMVVCGCATRRVRERHHDVFEATHRAGGWLCLLLFWLLIVITIPSAPSAPVWPVPVLGMITASVAAPWLRLRRVPVVVRVLSDHAAMLTVSYGVRPEVGATIAVSRRPWGQWHAFATIRLPERDGYLLLVSRAGDWTGRLIDDPPDHLWVRGMPLTSFARLERMYARVVVVVTGSGIGPFLGQLLAAQVPARLVWATREPRATYGDDLVDALLRAQPDALVWDTTEWGRPDLPRLAAATAHDFRAEAVFVTSNRATTAATVSRLQAEGFHAYGPIWDS